MVKVKRAKTKGPRLYQGALPSVTEVIQIISKPHFEQWKKAVGSGVADTTLRNAMQFGTRVHDAAKRVATGRPVKDSDLRPYAKAVEDFLEAHVAKIVKVEHELVSHWKKYGGTLDLYCELKDGSRAVIDWKTTASLTREHGLQVAAYSFLCQGEKLEVDRRIAVRLKKEAPGSYAVRQYRTYEEDLEAFFHLLGVWWWKNQRYRKALETVNGPAA